MVKRMLITCTKQVRRECDAPNSIFREYPRLFEYAAAIPQIVMTMGATRRMPEHAIPITCSEGLPYLLRPDETQLKMFLATFDMATRIETLIFFGLTKATVGVEVCFYKPVHQGTCGSHVQPFFTLLAGVESSGVVNFGAITKERRQYLRVARREAHLDAT